MMIKRGKVVSCNKGLPRIKSQNPQTMWSEKFALRQKRPEATKGSSVVTYDEGLSSIKSHDHFDVSNMTR